MRGIDAMIYDIAVNYGYAIPIEDVSWWWETYYRGRRSPWLWEQEIANEVRAKCEEVGR